MQWHQLDHMQTICTLLQIDNLANTSSLNFYRPVALPDAQPTVSKHWRQKNKGLCVINFDTMDFGLSLQYLALATSFWFQRWPCGYGFDHLA